MDNRDALDPARSVVVEACAGSGKTWLLVSRIVRLLLAGVPPGEILAITFTRKAAQEMQARLCDWLYELATAEDAQARAFLRQRGIDEADMDAVLPLARGLYPRYLQSQLTITTFHGWFMQIVKRAPLDAGLAGGVQLVEQTGMLWDEAASLYFAGLLKQPESAAAQSMRYLFEEVGLSSTQKLLRAFAAKRSEWWAYSAGQDAPLAHALAALRAELRVDMDSDPLAGLFARPHFADDVRALAAQLTASAAQKARAEKLLLALDGGQARRFELLWDELYTQKREPRAIKANKGQDEAALGHTLETVRSQVWEAYQQSQAQNTYRYNEHALRCGLAMLESYQRLKRQQQAMDFADLEWRVCELLNHSGHAEYLQYKLDSRYSQVLLDEFQDTNPLQWQILQSWFAASAAAGSTPRVFVVGDPKQSIYRFRRADARLFGVVREFLQDRYGATCLSQNTTRRNAPAVIDAVNAVFGGLRDGQPVFAGFEQHSAFQADLPGHVEVLPLTLADAAQAGGGGDVLQLRNPLLTPYPEREEGAREREAEQFAARLRQLVGNWVIRDGADERPLRWRDVMVLVRRRTHLRVYEAALRRLHIPYLSSRRGGLLDTLEATDIQALLTFLMTPFADLQLAHVLRSPLFSCGDGDLMDIAAEAGRERTWWDALRQLAASGRASAHQVRAHGLLQAWLALAERLPVHDLLDRIYFSADAQRRYAAAVPGAMRAAVLANLQAFMEIALNIDAGRYPSLSRFLHTLSELRQADDNESPDEGAVDGGGDALRIYTVHESKGLEAPLVWLLDSNASAPADRGYDVLVDWPTRDARPAHFSVYGDKASRGAAREKYFAAEQALADREDMNLLYVAMTRAKQVLMVSGNGEQVADAWYERVATAQAGSATPCPFGQRGAACEPPVQQDEPGDADPRLARPLPTGRRKETPGAAQKRGIHLHALMQHLAPDDARTPPARDELQRRLNIPEDEFEPMWQDAQRLLAAPGLAEYFDPRRYLGACNEMPYVNARGEVGRIDRLVEFDGEVWVLDYKFGARQDDARHADQLLEYRSAMRSVYAGKTVRCALLYADGRLHELE